MSEYAYFVSLLILLAVLLAYLFYSIEKRGRVEDAQWLASQSKADAERQARWSDLPPGVSPVSAIAPQIERVRQDYLAALHSRPHDNFYRRGLLAAFREAVTRLSFFQQAKSQPEMQKHDA
jgi:hypothetical protein